MTISKELWHKAYLLLSTKRNDLSRNKLAELLGVNEQVARNLLFAYDNRKIISIEPERYKIEKKTTVLWLSDLHIPFENKISVETALEYGKKANPDTIVLGGDIVDFYKISTFLKDPTQRSIKEELKLAREWLYSLRGMFPDSKIIYIEGNHSYRIVRYLLKNAKELYEVLDNFLPDRLELDKLDIEYKSGAFKMGKLWFLHGHEVNVRSYNVEYVTNVMWKRIHDNFICGHWHRTQDKVWKNIGGKYYGGYAVGSLCQDLDYQPINNWNNGFAVIHFDDRGYYKVENKKIIDGEVY